MTQKRQQAADGTNDVITKYTTEIRYQLSEYPEDYGLKDSLKLLKKQLTIKDRDVIV